MREFMFEALVPPELSAADTMQNHGIRFEKLTSLQKSLLAVELDWIGTGNGYGVSRDFQRVQDWSRAVTLAGVASGDSPARMKPWPAPS